jgi:hypothetical protein
MLQTANGLMLPVSSFEHILRPIGEPMHLVRGAQECPSCGATLPVVAAVAEPVGADDAPDRLRIVQGRPFNGRLSVDQDGLAMYLDFVSPAPASGVRAGITRTG